MGGFDVASVEALLSPLGSGESHSPAEAKIWRRAILRVLSADNIMHLQLPLIIEEFSCNISRCCPVRHPHLCCMPPDKAHDDSGWSDLPAHDIETV